MKLKLLSIFILIVALLVPIPNLNASAHEVQCTASTLSIVSVETDSTVTIRVHNSPANTTFTVRMGEYGTLGKGGIVVGSTDSGDGGTFKATYDIPDELKGEARIAIRVKATSGHYLAYNWFWNDTSNLAPGYWGQSTECGTIPANQFRLPTGPFQPGRPERYEAGGPGKEGSRPPSDHRSSGPGNAGAPGSNRPGSNAPGSNAPGSNPPGQPPD